MAFIGIGATSKYSIYIITASSTYLFSYFILGSSSLTYFMNFNITKIPSKICEDAKIKQLKS